jgi:hypothetical protein
MICTACGRDSPSMLLGGFQQLGGGVCHQCVALADAMQDCWDAVPEPKPTSFASTVGHVMRVTIERNVP